MFLAQIFNWKGIFVLKFQRKLQSVREIQLNIDLFYIDDYQN